MLLALGLLLGTFIGALLVLTAALRLRVHRLDEAGRAEPWKGPSPFAQTNLLSSQNYDDLGRKKLRRLKLALGVVWVGFMLGLLQVVRQFLP